jgi:MerR family transcriptional regulator/heat shock protein HspR
MHGKNEPVYAIGIVSRIIGVHQQTIRNYERWGLVVPNRSEGGRRYYSQTEVEMIQKIREWIEVLGLNRAGVEVMRKTYRRIKLLEHENNQLKLELIKLRKNKRSLIDFPLK